MQSKMWDVNLINVENHGDFIVMVSVAVVWQSLLMSKHQLRVVNSL